MKLHFLFCAVTAQLGSRPPCF